MLLLPFSNSFNFFGSLNKQRDIIADNYGTYKTRYEDSFRLYGVNLESSLLYTKYFKNNAVTIGGVYGIGDSLRTYASKIVYTYQGVTIDLPLDTFLNSVDTGSSYIPNLMGFGLSVVFNDKLTIAFDYALTDWTKFKLLGKESNLAKRIQYAGGMEYIPDYKSVNSLKKIMRYRMGFKYLNSRLIVNNEQLSEYGITFGVGVPIIKSQSRSMLNIGMEYGLRGTESNSLSREQYTNFVVGFLLTPHKFDRWFVKRKID